MSWKLAITAATIVGALSAAPLAAQATETGITPRVTLASYYTRHHHRMSYGTGYRGRGTKTGGPAGGLPSRN